MGLNVQFVYGAGPDALFGKSNDWLRAEVMFAFGDKVHCPNIIDYTEYDELLRRMRSWNDPTVLVAHSCGNNSITHASVAVSKMRVPYMMVIAPSWFCPVSPLGPNVERATQVTSNAFDPFNLGALYLLSRKNGNTKTKLDGIRAGKLHVFTPGARQVRDRLVTEIGRALAA
jgi:hypothetical protein